MGLFDFTYVEALLAWIALMSTAMLIMLWRIRRER